jgi:hypothetical protein
MHDCTSKEIPFTTGDYVYTHEHDFGLSHMYMDVDRQLLTCSLCNQSYCEKCGKEVFIPSLVSFVESPAIIRLNSILFID